MGDWSRGAAAFACLAVLSACGTASAVPLTTDADTASTPAPTRDVAAIARDEIAALDALGYPIEIAVWTFDPGFENSTGGTATAYYPQAADAPTPITLSASAEDYEQRYDTSLDVAVRSMVRHEFGHALMYRLGYDSDADEPAVRALCPDRAADISEDRNWGHECAAETIGVLLGEARGADQLVAYGGLTISERSRENMQAVLDGSLSW